MPGIDAGMAGAVWRRRFVVRRRRRRGRAHGGLCKGCCEASCCCSRRGVAGSGRGRQPEALLSPLYVPSSYSPQPARPWPADWGPSGSSCWPRCRQAASSWTGLCRQASCKSSCTVLLPQPETQLPPTASCAPCAECFGGLIVLSSVVCRAQRLFFGLNGSLAVFLPGPLASLSASISCV